MMPLRFGIFFSIAALHACGPPPPVLGSSNATLTDLERAEQLHAAATIMLTHDHVLELGHFDDAALGGVTAMTMELTTDRLEWINGVRVDQSPEGWLPRFLAARDQLQALVDQSAGAFRIIETVADIDAAKQDGVLGIVVGTEGALPLEGSLARVEDLYELGWRKTQLRWAHPTQFATGSTITPLGADLVRALNRRGVVIDTMHLSYTELDQLLQLTNAPLLDSHDYPVGAPPQLDANYLRAIAETGGGHGVIGVKYSRLDVRITARRDARGLCRRAANHDQYRGDRSCRDRSGLYAGNYELPIYYPDAGRSSEPDARARRARLQRRRYFEITRRKCSSPLSTRLGSDAWI